LEVHTFGPVSFPLPETSPELQIRDAFTVACYLDFNLRNIIIIIIIIFLVGNRKALQRLFLSF